MADNARATMPSVAYDDAGKLVLRLALGVLILLHGISKLMNGIGGISGMVEKAGLPPVLAYGVYVGEVLAPLLIILGVFTRPAAWIVAFNMVVAIALAHRAQLWSLTGQGGWALELQGMYLFGAIAVALLGAGRYRVGPAAGRYH